jgi:hypothetical protein
LAGLSRRGDRLFAEPATGVADPYGLGNRGQMTTEHTAAPLRPAGVAEISMVVVRVDVGAGCCVYRAGTGWPVWTERTDDGSDRGVVSDSGQEEADVAGVDDAVAAVGGESGHFVLRDVPSRRLVDLGRGGQDDERLGAERGEGLSLLQGLVIQRHLITGGVVVAG